MRQQTNYKTLIGRINNEYYFCDYIFNHNDGFKGATGSVMTPISKEEYEERTNIDNVTNNYAEIWVEAVKSNRTTDSLKDFIESIIDEGDDFLFDLSYPEYQDQLREKLGLSEKEYPVIECTGGGRCFSKDQKFDEVYNLELLKKIIEIETD